MPYLQKLPIEAIASFKLDGYIKPLYVIWNDKKYAIDRILDVQHRTGWKYKVEIAGEVRILFLEQKRFKEGMSASWYVESVK